MDFVAIGVRSDNLMYIVYDENYAISIDSYDPEIVKLSLSCTFENQFYTTSEIRNLPKNHKERKLLCSLTTHSHFDHAGGDKELARLFPGLTQYSGFYNNKCRDGQIIQLSDFRIECIDTKCHTQDSFCFYINNKWLFAGDTLFFLGCGKFNDGTGSQMVEALEKIKRRVDENALILYEHDYRNGDVAFVKSLTEELMAPYDLPKDIDKKMFLTLKDEMNFNPFFRVLDQKGDKSYNITLLREAKNKFKSK